MINISELFGLRVRKFKKDGSRWQELLGIELELENVSDVPALPYWEVKADNSLRNGIEYILDQPYAGPSLEYALDEFFESKLNFKNSTRTSTHVHLNMTDSTVSAVRSMLMIMYTIEDALFNVVGEGRKWAGYSMALSEMDPVRLRQALSADDPRMIANTLAPAKNQERYYGFNTASLRKHGTVEFRYFPGGPTRTELEEWLDLIVAVKAAATDNTPDQLMERIYSPDGMYAFLERYLPHPWVGRLLRETSPDYMYNKFNQVAALASDPEFIESKDNVIFMTASFLRAVKTKLPNEEARKFIDDVAKQAPAMVPGDWYNFLEIARSKGGFSSPKAKEEMVFKKIKTAPDYGFGDAGLRYRALADPDFGAPVRVTQPWLANAVPTEPANVAVRRPTRLLNR